MEALFRDHTRLVHSVNVKYRRYLYGQIDWNNRLTGITGARGTGKTTLLLQHIADNFSEMNKALYVSLDNIWFTKNTLLELVDYFQAHGGTHLFLDEVHRYPNWSIALKNIYDSYPDLKVVFTGSSILEIYRSNADLSRRAVTYNLLGLSFREFLNFENKLNIEPFTLEDILQNHQRIAGMIISQIKVLPEFKKYLEYGYYPFYREGIKAYPLRLKNVVNTILENDLPAIENIEYVTIHKIKKMLMIVASLVPFSPNIAKLSSEIETNRANTVRYLDYLQKAGLTINLFSSKKGMSLMNKPDKIYLENTNLQYALATSGVNKGNLRETFFANQVRSLHHVRISQQGDFLVDDTYMFEVGGSSKSFDQIKNIQNSFVVTDDTETGFGNKIPLWLFGFLY
ncbi:MAG: ATP-binding protein [Cryomorphaceae bacterium]|nr:ATP-binding protein [Cryomorphaceae bacterium]